MQIISGKDEVENYIDNKIKLFFSKRSLLPFLGAGFSKKCKTRAKTIPDGEEAKSIMKSLISQHSPDLKDEISVLNSFDEVANYFYHIVPHEVIVEFIKDYFTNTKLDQCRIDFLRLAWPYIYTLNIDDAIERATGHTPILPNKSIRNKNITNAVFKLHGDANDEVNYFHESDGIIFSRKQYLQSLSKNKDMLNMFFEDFYNKNFLFIGCSLDNEMDLEYMLEKGDKKTAKSDKIYVTTSEPKGLKRIRLEKTFGINICLIIDDYTAFYNTLSNLLIDTVDQSGYSFEKFNVKKVEIVADSDYNKKLICGESEISFVNNVIKIPSFFIQRNKTKDIITSLADNNIVFIIGKRMSGKTFLLADIARSLANKNVYFFPSQVSFDSDFIKWIHNLQDAVLLFDTDTLIPSDVEEIYNNIYLLNENKIKFVFTINSSDRLMLSVPYTRVIDGDIIELWNSLEYNELTCINNELSKFGIANFTSESNILGNIIRYKDIYSRLSHELNSFSSVIDHKILKIFILNATFDKVYSSLYRALEIDYDNLKFAISRSNKSIEFEFSMSDLEVGQHASYKVITNSKSFLFAVLGNYILNSEDRTNSVSAIVEIVKQLKQFERLINYWKGLIAFDNLNQIFYKPNNGGAITLIFLIYNSLEPLLYNDSHYWMQRAKSIFYMKGKDIRSLQTAVEYALKPYYDSREMSRIRINASFQISMIYNRIVVLQDFKDRKYFDLSIKWICIALKENMHNSLVINNFLDDAKRQKNRNDFYKIAVYLLENPNYCDPQDREFIVAKIFQGFKHR